MRQPHWVYLPQRGGLVDLSWMFIGNGKRLHAFPITHSGYFYRAVCDLGPGNLLRDGAPADTDCKVCWRRIKATLPSQKGSSA